MAKSGRSYRAARAQLEAAPPPTPDEYADLADISDTSVRSGTGKDCSKTFPVPVARLLEAFGGGRDAWIGAPTELRTASERSVRLTCEDGTVVSAWFTDKGPQKSSVAIQHQGLDSGERRERSGAR